MLAELGHLCYISYSVGEIAQKPRALVGPRLISAIGYNYIFSMLDIPSKTSICLLMKNL